MFKLHVLLVQLPVPNNPSLNTPLAAGYLKAYAGMQGLNDLVEIELLPRRLADYAGDALLVDEIVARQPDVLGVSLYTWNSERSLAIVERVKNRLPELRVVVGGPEVQKDNLWVLQHPAVDVAVIGEGEQTFVELLKLFDETRRQGDEETRRQGDKEMRRQGDEETRRGGDNTADAVSDLPVSLSPSPPLSHSPCLPLSLSPCLSLSPSLLASVAGIAFRDPSGNLIFTPDRVSLTDLSVIPSPYLSGYLDVPEDGMLMVEVSRWCPYSCSFCLYGRNLGAKLGNRYFGLERVLAEMRWGRERGIKRIHFVEANLNLVPLFWPLMHALEDLNADRQMTFYAELRGEHLTEEVVQALDRANVRYVEVGLQTANPVALKASLRRTDLQKWAAGTRKLYAHNIEVYLDVILGLPADDETGIKETLDFIRREDLGLYDVFTLQVLPGTAVRQQAQQYGLSFQERPPYYVLGTDRLSYADLQRLRRDLKQGAHIPPDAVEGMPEPRQHALIRRTDTGSPYIDQLWLLQPAAMPLDEQLAHRLAAHVDVVLKAEDIVAYTPVLEAAIAANPSTLCDVYVLCQEEPPSVQTLLRWREALPFQPGYLDRVAIYQDSDPQKSYTRVSPRCFLVLPWTAQVEPATYAGIAEIIWSYDLAVDEQPPLGAWAAAGGVGIWVRGRTIGESATWQERTDQTLWYAAQ